ncbi:biotin--[acetyl-CoA-carboxylase] ligase [Algimonas porphyrae]|uniref:biotin--[biotin carboxyl-carrier protein] ligase n=1 Tax=Algimonas porphyrae TaxID=1128113 RepID=A0ABQ5UZK5_9PROT|nr:biotin--[acetyl-CoA-carboxylase] ligase [Algimonas porphyrae]GLQ20277.1 biotin--[acetyl-CoA-carboxylase] ligase [Algimonas porphyrae]
MQFIHRDRVGSTQDEARALYQAGERGPLWVRAAQQTAGRGRRDRQWVSAVGNLYATLLLPNDLPPAQSALHGFAASLAIASTLDVYRPVQPVTLKWPNDVLLGGAKVSGLLVEREAEALLIGIGINLVSHPDDLPYAATHLVAGMSPMDLAEPQPLYTGAESVLAVLSAQVMDQIERLRLRGFDPIRTDWLARAHHLGRRVTVNGMSGIFENLAPDGALCLTLDNGTQTRVHAGDVAFG